MYKIVVNRFGDDVIILAENYRELKDIVNLSPKVNDEIRSIEYIDLEYAKDYLKEIRKIIYPKNKDLVFGNNEGY